MRIKFVEIQNFRKLHSCRLEFAEDTTVIVGANNSGKTSAMYALIKFLGERRDFLSTDFTLSNWLHINNIGKDWIDYSHNRSNNCEGLEKSNDLSEVESLSLDRWIDYLPALDLWLDVKDNELHYVSHLIPTLEWKGGMIGVRLRLEPKSLERLHKEYLIEFNSAQEVLEKAKRQNEESKLKLWPRDLHDFCKKRLKRHFEIKAYLLDPDKLEEPKDGVAKAQKLGSDSYQLNEQLLSDDFDSDYSADKSPLKRIIKIDIINAQRGFSDIDSSSPETISEQVRNYYSTHLDHNELPDEADLAALESTEEAKAVFGDLFKERLANTVDELSVLGYPGVDNPKLTFSTEMNPTELLNHDSAVQYEVIQGPDSSCDHFLRLPENHNGLGFRNLISMTFKLIRFRDDWMQVGKLGQKKEIENSFIEPLHLVLVEEPEAHLHAQVQQVFIKNAYKVLRKNKVIKDVKRFSTQLVVSTHSSHIAHEVDFGSLRYFRRKMADGEGKVPTATVVNLSDTFGDKDETEKFVKRYLKATHCDLFFADATIIVEGTAERMLVPHFIGKYDKSNTDNKNYKERKGELGSCYLSFLEIGGSHAHRLRALIEKLGIITLIITDIDACNKDGKSVMIELGKGYLTSNPTLKKWFQEEKTKLGDKVTIDELLNMPESEKVKSVVRFAYQNPIELSKSETVYPTTFEDSLAYENISIFKELEGTGMLGKFKDAINKYFDSNISDISSLNQSFYSAIRKGNKGKFALEVLFGVEPENLKIPKYILEGLDWLRDILVVKSELGSSFENGLTKKRGEK